MIVTETIFIVGLLTTDYLSIDQYQYTNWRTTEFYIDWWISIHKFKCNRLQSFLLCHGLSYINVVDNS